MPKKAAIIGSGIAGIAAALRLRKQGFEVDVFEKNSYPGGKLTEITVGKYRFDAGPSLFTLPHLVDELFQIFDTNPSEYFKYSKEAIACHYFWEDGSTFLGYADQEKFASECEKTFGESKLRVLKALRKHEKDYDITSKVFLEKSLHKAGSYLNVDFLKGLLHLPFLSFSKSMHEISAHKFKSDKLIQIFNRYATYNGSNPYTAPGMLNMISHLETGIGTFYPKNGMHSITKSLVELAQKKEVSFHYNSIVDKIIVENNKAKGIEVNGTTKKYDAVVCNSDVFTAYKTILSEHQIPKRLKKAEPSSSALIFYWGIKKSFKQLGLHNIFFSENYKEEFHHLFKKKTLFEDPTVYVNISSKNTPEHAPKDCENWFVMINAPHLENQNWEELISKARENILKKLSKILNCNIESLIEEEKMLTPQLIFEKTNSHLGSLYGISSNSKMSAFLRHENFSSKIKNLYFCGGSVHPGGGIPLCLLSAKIVGNIVKDDFK